jgi:phosphate transport system substrate-binding protein
MSELLQRYEKGFREYQPGVRFDNALHSTLTAVAGVYTGRAEIGVLGREIWPAEEQAFESVAGYAPMVISVATGSYDVPKATFALMVFVHRTNPILSLSMKQLERIFAKVEDPVRTWGEVGVQGPQGSHEIHLYGFTTENDKAVIFRRLVFGGETRWSCRLQEFANGPGVDAMDAGEFIARAVANDPDGIGISNVHYASKDVRALAIAVADEPMEPTRENVAARVYPLARSVYFVLDSNGKHPLDAATEEFLRYVLSRQGSADVRREGNYLALPAAVANEQRRRLHPDTEHAGESSNPKEGAGNE